MFGRGSRPGEADAEENRREVIVAGDEPSVSLPYPIGGVVSSALESAVALLREPPEDRKGFEGGGGATTPGGRTCAGAPRKGSPDEMGAAAA